MQLLNIILQKRGTTTISYARWSMENTAIDVQTKTKKILQKTNITIIGLEKRMTTYLVEKYTVSRCKDLIHVISKLFVKIEEDFFPYQCSTACYIMLSNSHQHH